MFELNWDYIDNVGFVRESTFKLDDILSEGYIIDGIKGTLKKGMTIDDFRYVNEYPNLKLARLLGHPKLKGDNWKNSTYDESYYFSIRMQIKTHEMGRNIIWGSLRISDHKTSPYAFGDNARFWNKFGKKRYTFGVSIVFPRFNYSDDGSLPDGREVHVFEHIFMDSSNKEETLVNNLKNALDDYVGSMKKIMTVGNDGYIKPTFYGEITNGKKLFDTKDVDNGFAGGVRPVEISDSKSEVWHDRKEKVKEPEADPRLKNFDNRKLSDFNGYKGMVLSDVVAETGMQPIPIYVTKKGRGNSIPYVKIGNSETLYPTRQYRGLLMPCMPDNQNKLVKLDTGIYVWKNWMGNDMSAAIIDGFETIDLLLKPKPKRGRPVKNLSEEIERIIKENISRYIK